MVSSVCNSVSLMRFCFIKCWFGLRCLGLLFDVFILTFLFVCVCVTVVTVTSRQSSPTCTTPDSTACPRASQPLTTTPVLDTQVGPPLMLCVRVCVCVFKGLSGVAFLFLSLSTSFSLSSFASRLMIYPYYI